LKISRKQILKLSLPGIDEETSGEVGESVLMSGPKIRYRNGASITHFGLQTVMDYLEMA